jgi:hypothetical protein
MIESLLKRCDEFEKRVKFAVSVIENTDPVLKQLSDLEDFDDRIKFAEKKWEKLGEGSSRTVFKINDFLIIKIAHNKKGIAQNENEMNPELQTCCVTKTIVADAKCKWLVTHLTDSMTKEDFKKKMGFSFDMFSKALLYAFNNEDDVKEPKNYDEIKKHPFFKCVSRVVINGSLLVGDLEKVSSYGIKNGEIYLRDYGFTKEIFEDFYEDKST